VCAEPQSCLSNSASLAKSPHGGKLAHSLGRTDILVGKPSSVDCWGPKPTVDSNHQQPCAFVHLSYRTVRALATIRHIRHTPGTLVVQARPGMRGYIRTGSSRAVGTASCWSPPMLCFPMPMALRGCSSPSTALLGSSWPLSVCRALFFGPGTRDRLITGLPCLLVESFVLGAWLVRVDGTTIPTYSVVAGAGKPRKDRAAYAGKVSSYVSIAMRFARRKAKRCAASD